MDILFINHCQELVKSVFIRGAELIFERNYADFLKGEVEKTLYTGFAISISALGTVSA